MDKYHSIEGVELTTGTEYSTEIRMNASKLVTNVEYTTESYNVETNAEHTSEHGNMATTPEHLAENRRMNANQLIANTDIHRENVNGGDSGIEGIETESQR